MLNGAESPLRFSIYGPMARPDLGSFSLASSVSAGKGNGKDEIRRERIKTLQSVWPHSLIRPTPVQRAHAKLKTDAIDLSEELFGIAWGHCGESITFASMHRKLQSGTSMGTLALGVKAMTSRIPGTDLIPTQVIPKLQNVGDVVQILRISGALRPMCLNCQYLNATALGRTVDFARKFSNL